MRLKDKLLKTIDAEREASRSDDVAKAIQSLQRETEARKECARLGVDPDEICADGGVEAWMVVAKETESLAAGMALAGDVQAGPNSPEPSVPSTYNRLTNSTWRLFEEQRMHALETAQECDAIIKAAEARRDDALRTVDMCVAAQKIGERV